MVRPMTTPLFLLILSFLLLSVSVVSASSGSSTTTGSTSFIKAQCGTTQYPTLCVQCLSAYAPTIGQSHQQLAQAALSVSVSRAKSAVDFVSRSAKLQGLKRGEVAAVKDCLDEVRDAVDRLSRSVDEMKMVGGSRREEEFVWHVSNVETWVSAALTDENTCMDGFSGKALDGSLKSSMRPRILNVAQVTSNALALVTRYASKH